MSSKPDSLFSFRSLSLAEYYDRTFGRSYRHQAVKTDIERYRALLKKSMPILTKVEALSIFSFLEGLNPVDGDISLLIQAKIVEEMEDNLMPELARKVKAFSPAEWMAVLDACVRASAIDGCTYRLTDKEASLTNVGLIV